MINPTKTLINLDNGDVIINDIKLTKDMIRGKDGFTRRKKGNVSVGYNFQTGESEFISHKHITILWNQIILSVLLIVLIFLFLCLI